VPEIEDIRGAGRRFAARLLARDAYAQGGPMRRNEPVSGGDDDAEDDALAESERGAG